MPKQAEITEAVYLAFAAIKQADQSFPELVYENINHQPSGDYVQIFVLPTKPVSKTLGCDTWGGLIQASIYTQEGVGALPGEQIADKIIAAFARGTRLAHGSSRLRVVKDAWAADIYASGKGIRQGWSIKPVTIIYEAK